MKYITSLHAYDCLSEVVYAVTVRGYADYEEGKSEVVLDLRGCYPGKGEDRPEFWLRELLIELSKSL